jgi:hypothetical protein
MKILRSVLVLALTSVSTVFLFGQEDEMMQSNDVLDEGFGKLKIDAQMADVKTFLTAAKPGELMHADAADVDGEYLTSGWLFNLTKAGVSTYHGLKITRIEVYFSANENYVSGGSSDQAGQDIYSFAVFIEKPADNESGSFIQSHFDAYGGASYMNHPETDEPVGFTWWTDQTMLDLRLGYDFEEEKEFDFYLAEWRRAYG